MVVCCQILVAETLTEVFRDNAHLCSKVTVEEVEHFVDCIEKCRNVKFLKFLQTVVMRGGRRVQDIVIGEVCWWGRDVNRDVFSRRM